MESKNYVSSIDKAISHYEVEHDLTKEQMAESLDMSANTLRWKREGAREWRLSELLKLSDITGLSLEALTGRAKSEAI